MSKVYVVTAPAAAGVIAVCANITLARKKVSNDVDERDLWPEGEVETSDDAWRKTFNCCSEEQRTNMATHRDDEPYWERRTYTHESGNKFTYFIDEVEMTGDPVLSAIGDLRRLILGTSGIPSEFTRDDLLRLAEMARILLRNVEDSGMGFSYVSDTFIPEEIDLLKRLSEMKP